MKLSSPLTIIPYNPIPTKANRGSGDRHCAKNVSKGADEPQAESGALPVDTLQTQPTASTCMDSSQSNSDAGSTENNTDIGSPVNEFLDDIKPKNNSLTTEIRTDAGSKVDGSEMQEIISEIGGAEAIRRPLKRKQEIGGQGSQDSPLVIDSDADDTDDSQIWKRQKPTCSSARGQVRFWKTFGRANGEANGAEFEISSDAQSEDDDSASEIGNGESYKPYRLDRVEVQSELADRVKAQSIAKVGDNGEWGVHGIIGKEIIEGTVYYCVDWLPTMIPVNKLKGAERLIRKFEAKEKARLRRAGKGKHRTQRRKHM